jgi:tripartite-type tricarboxylate transporter receptor subunit TctC
MLHLVRWCSIVFALLAFPALAQAQSSAQSYPDRPIKLVVAFPPGGATDTFIRNLVEDLKTAFGQPVIIENRGGGGGYIAWGQVAASEPDGYTLLVAENALGVSQALYKKHPSNFDPLKQYDAIAEVAYSPLVLCIANNVPAKNFSELVAYSKTLPQKMNYAHAGAGSVSHLVFEVIRDGAGMETVPVPYKGGGPAMGDVVAGHVAAVMAAVSVGKAQAEGGKVKALAVTGAARSPALPNVPTLKELGVKHADVDLSFWWGIFGPKGIPQPVKAKIEKAFQTVMADPKIRERLTKVGITSSFASGPQLQKKLENEIKNWTAFIDAKGIKPE